MSKNGETNTVKVSSIIVPTEHEKLRVFVTTVNLRPISHGLSGIAASGMTLHLHDSDIRLERLQLNVSRNDRSRGLVRFTPSEVLLLV